MESTAYVTTRAGNTDDTCHFTGVVPIEHNPALSIGNDASRGGDRTAERYLVRTLRGDGVKIILPGGRTGGITFSLPIIHSRKAHLKSDPMLCRLQYRG